jgi:phosphoribosyl 1,2-cyclic phosphate phosphodiesterase
MELLICGTGAAEGWPALFCHCGPCAAARERGGKNLRSRAAYMLGERIRIDFGPDSFYHQQRYGLAYGRLEALLLSHGHADHWLPRELYYRRPGFSIVPEEKPLAVYGSARSRELLHAQIDGDEPRFRLRFREVEPFVPIELPDGVRAIPITAAHDPTQLCVNYLLEVPAAGSAVRRVLVGHDTGWYEEPSWEFLAGTPLDAVLLDCTGGSLETRKGHMSCSVVCEFRVIATHFSHNGEWLHDELEAYLNPRAVEVAHDGMRVDLG